MNGCYPHKRPKKPEDDQFGSRMACGRPRSRQKARLTREKLQIVSLPPPRLLIDRSTARVLFTWLSSRSRRCRTFVLSFVSTFRVPFSDRAYCPNLDPLIVTLTLWINDF